MVCSAVIMQSVVSPCSTLYNVYTAYLLIPHHYVTHGQLVEIALVAFASTGWSYLTIGNKFQRNHSFAGHDLFMNQKVVKKNCRIAATCNIFGTKGSTSCMGPVQVLCVQGMMTQCLKKFSSSVEPLSAK